MSLGFTCIYTQLERWSSYNPLLVQSGFLEVLASTSKPQSKRGSSSLSLRGHLQPEKGQNKTGVQVIHVRHFVIHACMDIVHYLYVALDRATLQEVFTAITQENSIEHRKLKENKLLAFV